MRSSEEGVQEAAIVKIRSGWKKFTDVTSVLCERVVALKLQGSLVKSCVGIALC